MSNAIFKQPVSIFRGTAAQRINTTTLGAFLAYLKDAPAEHKERAAAMVELRKTDAERYKAEKKNLHSIVFADVKNFKNRPTDAPCVMPFDFDAITDLNKTLQELKAMTEVVAVFHSPSGVSIRFLVAIEGVTLQTWGVAYASIFERLKSKLEGLGKLDKLPNISQIYFFSALDLLFLNNKPQAIYLELSAFQPIPTSSYPTPASAASFESDSIIFSDANLYELTAEVINRRNLVHDAAVYHFAALATKIRLSDAFVFQYAERLYGSLSEKKRGEVAAQLNRIDRNNPKEHNSHAQFWSYCRDILGEERVKSLSNKTETPAKSTARFWFCLKEGETLEKLPKGVVRTKSGFIIYTALADKRKALKHLVEVFSKIVGVDSAKWQQCRYYFGDKELLNVNDTRVCTKIDSSLRENYHLLPIYKNDRLRGRFLLRI